MVLVHRKREEEKRQLYSHSQHLADVVYVTNVKRDVHSLSHSRWLDQSLSVTVRRNKQSSSLNKSTRHGDRSVRYVLHLAFVRRSKPDSYQHFLLAFLLLMGMLFQCNLSPINDDNHQDQVQITSRVVNQPTSTVPLRYMTIRSSQIASSWSSAIISCYF